MFQGAFSENGFKVIASNSLDLITGTNAASSGFIASNIRESTKTLHSDLSAISKDLVSSNLALREINKGGFDAVCDSMNSGFSSISALSGLSIAVQAVGFISVLNQIKKSQALMSSGFDLMDDKLSKMNNYQMLANAKLDTLVNLAEKSLITQDKILESLINSRMQEAQQLAQHGWENAKHEFFDDAKLCFENALQYDSTFFVAHSSLADIYRMEKLYERAENHFKKAIAFGNGQNDEFKGYSHLSYARYFDETGNYTSAIRETKEALKCFDKPEWRFYLAELYVESEFIDDSLKELEIAIFANAELFATAMFSERLARLDKRLTKLLIEIDSKLRGRLVEEIIKHRNILISVIGFEFTYINKNAKQCLNVSEELMKQICEEPYQHLVLIQDKVSSIGQDANIMIQEMIEAVWIKFKKLTSKIKFAISQRPPLETELVKVIDKRIIVFVLTVYILLTLCVIFFGSKEVLISLAVYNAIVIFVLAIALLNRYQYVKDKKDRLKNLWTTFDAVQRDVYKNAIGFEASFKESYESIDAARRTHELIRLKEQIEAEGLPDPVLIPDEISKWIRQ